MLARLLPHSFLAHTPLRPFCCNTTTPSPHLCSVGTLAGRRASIPCIRPPENRLPVTARDARRGRWFLPLSGQARPSRTHIIFPRAPRCPCGCMSNSQYLFGDRRGHAALRLYRRHKYVLLCPFPFLAILRFPRFRTPTMTRPHLLRCRLTFSRGRHSPESFAVSRANNNPSGTSYRGAPSYPRTRSAWYVRGIPTQVETRTRRV